MTSKEKNFIYIHLPKTGGTSICHALSKFATEDYKVHDGKLKKKDTAYRLYIDGKHFNKHELLVEVKNRLEGSFYNNAFKFTCVRNPYERVISHYFWKFETNEFNRKKFIDFFSGKKKNNTHWGSQKRSVTIENKVEMDYIIKMENIQEDFNEVCSQLNIDKIILPHKNKTNHSHYREYYNDNMKNLVTEWYKEDIEFFKYNF